jgi:DNA-directed RNA polymerase specialized sigma24 family protein
MHEGSNSKPAHTSSHENLRVPKLRSRRTAELRDGDEQTLIEFFLYFQPILVDQARLMGIQPAARKEIVVTFLDDKVQELAAMDLPPRSLTGYVIRSFRNRVRNIARDANTRERKYSEAALEAQSSAPLLVAEEGPAYETNESGENSTEPGTPSLPIARLAQFAKSLLSEHEVQLLIEVARRVPLREIAEWHHISYAACRVRVHRLRARVGELAQEYVKTLPSDEKLAVERFLRRCGAWEE